MLTSPNELKVSILTSIYKRKHLHVNELSSYRPVAELSFVAKLLEKHVAQHLRHYSENNKINDMVQRVNHIIVQKQLVLKYLVIYAYTWDANGK